MERETEGFPLTSIREINILLALHHKNIVNVTEVSFLLAVHIAYLQHLPNVETRFYCPQVLECRLPL